MDFLARRALRRVTATLLLEDGEAVLDFDVGEVRPWTRLPPPFPAEFPPREHGKVDIVATDQALHLAVRSRSIRELTVVRIPWDDFVELGTERGAGRWPRWYLIGRTARDAIDVPIAGRPRRSMVRRYATLGPGGA